MSSRPKVIERNEMFFKEHFSRLSQTRTTRNDNSNASGIFWDLVAPKTRSLLTLCYAYTCKLSGTTKASSLWGQVVFFREQWHVYLPNPYHIRLRRPGGGDTLYFSRYHDFKYNVYASLYVLKANREKTFLLFLSSLILNNFSLAGSQFFPHHLVSVPEKRYTFVKARTEPRSSYSVDDRYYQKT